MPAIQQLKSVCLATLLALSAGAAPVLPFKIIPPTTNTTTKTEMVTWTSNEKKFNIHSGTNITSLKKLTTIATNVFCMTNGVVYGVAAVDDAGVASELAYWPSNRIGEIRLRESTRTNYVVLQRFTNSPPESQRFWRVEDVTVGWQ